MGSVVSGVEMNRNMSAIGRLRRSPSPSRGGPGGSSKLRMDRNPTHARINGEFHLLIVPLVRESCYGVLGDLNHTIFVIFYTGWDYNYIQSISYDKAV